jgi:hypothetical protein
MGISQDAVRQRSKREGWMASPKAIAQRALAKPVTSVSPTALSPADALRNVLSERKHRSRLALSKYTAEAAEAAAEHRDKLLIARKVKDVASVHKALWPEETHGELIDGAILIGMAKVVDNPEEIREARSKGLLEVTGNELPPRHGVTIDVQTGEVVKPAITEGTLASIPRLEVREQVQSENDDRRTAVRIAYEKKCMYWRSERGARFAP